MKSLLIILSLSILAVMPRAQAQDDLVEVGGQVKPEFSVEVSDSELSYIARGLEDLKDLPKIRVDINDLFEPEDREAIAEARMLISNDILFVAKKLIDIRAMIYKLSALQKVYGKSDRGFKQLRNAYEVKMRNSYVLLLSKNLVVENSFKDALKKCSSVICVKTISDAKLEMIRFAEAINKTIKLHKRKNTTINWRPKSDIVKLSIRDTAHSTSGDTSYEKLLRNTVVSFGQKSVLDTIKASNVAPFKMKLTKVPRRLVKDAKKEIQNLHERQNYFLINGSLKNAPKRLQIEFVGVDVITCYKDNTYGDTVGYDVGVFGLIDMTTNDSDGKCHSLRRGEINGFKIYTVGFGLRYQATSASILVTSGIYITEETEAQRKRPYRYKFVGAGFDVQPVIGGGMSVFVGGKGAIAYIASVGLGVGASAGIKFLEVDFN